MSDSSICRNGIWKLAGKDAGKAFWAWTRDAEAFARFIARFLVKVQRVELAEVSVWGKLWDDEVGSAGRSAGEREEHDLNGVMLLGTGFQFSHLDGPPRPGMDLTYELALPTYAATAWYHKKLSPSHRRWKPFLKEVEDYALGEYMHALAQGK